MVLYYNQIAVPLAATTEPSLLLSSDLKKRSNELYTSDKPELGVYQENKGLLENLSRNLFGDDPELYSRILEEDFSNLSMDEKINYLFRINIIQNKTTSKHLRIALFLLVLIVFKLYF
tara:strand:+ start:311 stop:664 length:354 start_codon:yes stop_codon:yes gene_type:complete